MSIKIQIMCFSISFVFGIIVYLMEQFHRKLIKNKYFISKIVIMLLATFILVIGYVDVLYWINGGIFHIYFLLVIILGYIVGWKKIRLRRKKDVNIKQRGRK